MATSASSSVLGKAETDFTQAAGVDRVTADKNTFLKLLVAQLTHQDPLNPTEDKEFIAQLAQFTSLEQLQGINEGVGTLNSTMQQSQLVSATSFIGKEVLASGGEISKIGSYISTVYFTIDEAIAKGQVNIFDQNGNLVRTDKIEASNAGDFQYQWDGKNSSGKDVVNGIYKVVISAQDANDKAVLPVTQVTGRVIGVQTENGVNSLRLSDGRVVKFTDVTEVMNSVESTNTTLTNGEKAANAAAAATIAADTAAAAADTAADTATTTAAAKTAAENAIKAAATAKTAAETAETAAKDARTAAEADKTAKSLAEANAAKESASEAKAAAEAAEHSAAAAKAAAIAKGAIFD